MSTYVIANLEIHDRETYGQYEAGFIEIFAKYQGKLLAVDEAQRVLEGGEAPTRTVVLEFPSDLEARRWYDSAEYQELMKHRVAASSGDIRLVTGIG
jgi:uncharacterized protein (DUF1330 family)